jgi:chemotaxis protein CheD
MIQINEVDVSEEAVEYTCFGLGSCIGLFVSDRIRGICGAAHIPLPDNENGTEDFHDAARLVRLLLKGFELKGSDLQTLRAKVAGGSSIYKSVAGIGAKNIEAVMNLLVEHRIYVAATDLGGTVSRTARYDSRTGDVHIRTSEKKSYFI